MIRAREPVPPVSAEAPARAPVAPAAPPPVPPVAAASSAGPSGELAANRPAAIGPSLTPVPPRRRRSASTVIAAPRLTLAPGPRVEMPEAVAETMLRTLAKWAVRARAADLARAGAPRGERDSSGAGAPVSRRVPLEVVGGKAP